MSLLKELSELVNNRVISEETSQDILAYYSKDKGDTNNRLFVVFGVLGAILVGLGIILILAHNWDDLSRSTKTIFAILPLLIGQGFCFYTISKKQDVLAWKEASSVFLFFAIGSSISLVSQIYNIPGNFNTFMLSWMLLSLPLVYLLNSSVVGLLYIIGITVYATESYHSYSGSSNHLLYLIWVLLVFPHFYTLYQKNSRSNFITIAFWIIPISLSIVLGAFGRYSDELLFIAYMSLYGIFYIIGKNSEFKHRRLIGNGFLVIGSLGTIILLMVMSFDAFWDDIYYHSKRGESHSYIELIVSFVLSSIAIFLLFLESKKKKILELSPMSYVFLIFIFIYILGMLTVIGPVLINLLILGLSLWTIREGARQDHFGILNYGLMIITILTICRFFDTDLSFVFRGLLFVIVGIGFFGTNYWMIKKRKENEK